MQFACCMLVLISQSKILISRKRGEHSNFKKGGKSRRGGMIEEGGIEMSLHTMGSFDHWANRCTNTNTEFFSDESNFVETVNIML